MATRKPKADWLAAVKPLSRYDELTTHDSPGCAIRSDGRILLAETTADADLTTSNSGKILARTRTAEIRGTVAGLRAAMRPLKAFAAEGSAAVTIAANGALVVSAECWLGSAASRIDGADYTHAGPDAEARFTYKCLMQALDGLPDTLEYSICDLGAGVRALRLAGNVKGAQREAVIAALKPRN